MVALEGLCGGAGTLYSNVTFRRQSVIALWKKK